MCISQDRAGQWGQKIFRNVRNYWPINTAKLSKILGLETEDVFFEILRKVGDTTSWHDGTSQKTWSADSFMSCWFHLTSFNFIFYTAELHAKGNGSWQLCNFKYHPGICVDGTSVQRVLLPRYERWPSRTHTRNVNTRPRSSVCVYSVKLEGNKQNPLV